MSGFKKATKKQSKLRLALYGPSGSGKTFTALRIAGALGSSIAVIDTERGSASKYAGDVADFDVLELSTFEPAKYIKAITDAAAARYQTLVIDSLSHAWMGRGGLLDQADAKGGRFDAWKSLTPQHHALVEAILAFHGDVIVTMRSKTEYVVEQNEKGKSTPRKVGTAPVQKDGMEYEFDVAASLNVDNVMTVEKSRCPGLQGAVIRHPGADIAATLRAWLNDGAAAEPAALPSESNSLHIASESLEDTIPDSVDYATKLSACATVGNLNEVWAEMPRDARAAFCGVKDAMKSKLSARHREEVCERG